MVIFYKKMQIPQKSNLLPYYFMLKDRYSKAYKIVRWLILTNKDSRIISKIIIK